MENKIWMVSCKLGNEAINASALWTCPFLIFDRSLLTRCAFNKTSEISATDSPGPLIPGTPMISCRGPEFG